MTWFGYVYAGFAALGVAMHIANAGEDRDPWPSGWFLVGVLAIHLAVVVGVYTVGVRP